MDFYWVYDLPTWQFALLSVIFFVAFAIAGLLIFRKFIFSRIIPQSHNDIVSYFMAGLNAVYGITLGLIAVGAWENFSAVDDAVTREAAALSSLYQDLHLVQTPLGDTLRSQLREYTTYTIKDAWPQQQKGKIPSGGTERLTRFQENLAKVDLKTKTEEIIFAETYAEFNRLIEYRRIRLQNITTALPAAVWYVIFFGAFLNIIITWFFVSDKFHVHLLMMALFAALLGSLVFLVAAMDNPFRGELSVGADAFELILSKMK
jgi:Protein of unknown function (DUF4239)